LTPDEIAPIVGAFPQSILIEIGMGALLFCVLDVIIVRRLKLRIENLEQQVRESYDEMEEIEERERAFGKFIDVENWDPDDFCLGYPNNYGGFDTEDNDREWRG
jgi:hypothetical protein